MAAPYHHVCSKLDRALVAYLISKDAGTVQDVVPAKRSLDKDLPITICWTERAKLDLNTGTWACTVSIIVKSPAPADVQEDPAAKPADSDVRFGKTVDAFFTVDDDSEWDSKKIAAQITAAAAAAAEAHPEMYGDLADLSVLNIRLQEAEQGFVEDADAFQEILALEADVAPSAVG